MTSGLEDEEFFRERGFGLTLGFGKRPAVIVVDLINAFTKPDLPLGCELETQIESTNKLLDAAHQVRVPIIFSTVAYDGDDLEDGGLWPLKHKGSATLRAGTELVEVDPKIHRDRSDMLLVKKYASCFFGTDLSSRLTSRQIDTVIITGCSTSGCVRATAIDAIQGGFRPMVVREAVGDRSVAAHDQSLFDLRAKYADVVSLDDTLRYLQAMAHP
ncbi:MAG TPA: isochorismatase family protein [Pseudolabrys sp.]|nr:isochorismatase family protein [Pseudolabrys sp.]